MLWFYRMLFIPMLALMAPRYLRRMKVRGGYRENFRHRFGRHPKLRKEGGHLRVWLQAVSVGEMFAIGPIVEGLRRDGIDIYLTTTTSTGYRIAQDRYHALTEGIGYFPLDWWPYMARAWKRIQPDLAILTEGERWPEFLHQAEKRGVPVLCINARLSDRSFGRMKSFPLFTPMMFTGVTRLLPCSTQDEARFRDLGVPAEALSTTGNIKLDVQIPALAEAERAQLRRELGVPADTLVLLGSSTWPGEEAALIGALRRAREQGVHCTLVVVPRHAERRLEIDRLVRQERLRIHLRSRGPAPAEVDVAVADTTGELRRITQLADLVFVGKSLDPHTEGQTPVEAASLEKPILMGPGMSNFRIIARDLVERGAAREVADPAALAQAVAELLRDATRREELAAAAAQWHHENGGAVARTLAIIREELGKVRAKAQASG